MAEPSTSKEVQEKTGVKELFDMKNFPHWLDMDEDDYDDFNENDRKENPEYFLTDEQVEEIFKEMSDKEKKNFFELREYHEADYRQKGEIRPLSEYIKQIVKWLKPGIPTESQEIHTMLREKLLAKARMKSELRENPRLELPYDPDENIWKYYEVMKVTPIIVEDLMVVLLTIPLTDKSLTMNVY